jgi:hypothetical protein
VLGFSCYALKAGTATGLHPLNLYLHDLHGPNFTHPHPQTFSIILPVEKKEKKHFWKVLMNIVALSEPVAIKSLVF